MTTPLTDAIAFEFTVPKIAQVDYYELGGVLTEQEPIEFVQLLLGMADGFDQDNNELSQHLRDAVHRWYPEELGALE